jgi:hypothetical protein
MGSTDASTLPGMPECPTGSAHRLRISLADLSFASFT